MSGTVRRVRVPAVGNDLDTKIATRVMRSDLLLPYSTDIAAAWKVVERMESQGIGWIMTDPPGSDEAGKYQMCLFVPLGDPPEENGQFQAEGFGLTVTEAICRAALDADDATEPSIFEDGE